jgi:hypothetical protein
VAKNFHNGTNIIAKQDTIFLGEKILEIIMAAMGKTQLSLLGVDSSALSWSLKFKLASLTG